MAYDVHIVRTESWPDAANDPVTKEQVDALRRCGPGAGVVGRGLGGHAQQPREEGHPLLRDPVEWGAQLLVVPRRDPVRRAGRRSRVGKMVAMAAASGPTRRGRRGGLPPDNWRAVYRGEIRA